MLKCGRIVLHEKEEPVVKLHKPVNLVIEADVEDKSLETVANEATMTLRLAPSEAFLNLVEKHGFTQRGATSWAINRREARSIVKFFEEYNNTFAPRTLHEAGAEGGVTRNFLTNSGRLHYTHPIFYNYSQTMYVLQAMSRTLNSLPVPREYSRFCDDLNYGRGGRAYGLRRAIGREEATKQFQTGTSLLGAVSVEVTEDSIWLRVFPVTGITEEIPELSYTKMRNVRYARNVRLTPRQVQSVVKTLASKNLDPHFDARSNKGLELLKTLQQTVTVGYTPNKPAQAIITVGEDVKIRANNMTALRNYKAGVPRQVAVATALKLEKENKTTKFLIHPGMLDVANMVKAKPVKNNKLEPYQREAVGIHLATEIGYLNACSPGLGKGHPLSTKVLTPLGWRTVGELKVGDSIFGSDGTPTKVTGVYDRGVLDTYKVTFNDGSSVVVDGDHLWAVQTKNGIKGRDKIRNDDVAAGGQLSVNQRIALVEAILGGESPHSAALKMNVSHRTALLWYKKYKEEGWSGLRNKRVRSENKVMSTLELSKNLHFPDGTRRWRIPMVEPIQYEPQESLPVPAYTLGVILGDGSIGYGSVGVTSADVKMHELLRSDLKEISELKVKRYSYADRTDRYSIVTEPKGATNPVTEALKEMNLMGTHSYSKFIPEQYLRASLEDRIALFQGLMDSDGFYSVKSKYLQWGSTSSELSNGMAEIVESFGGSVRRKTKVKYFTDSNGNKKEGRPYYSLSIALPNGILPFRLERKLKGYTPRKWKPVRIISSIEPFGREEVRCISVAAENRLYVTEHHIVTHNTVMSLAAMQAKAATNSNYRGLVVCEANVRQQWIEEANVWFPEAEVFVIKTRNDVLGLAEALSKAKPVVIIMSYAHTLLIHEMMEADKDFGEQVSVLKYADKLEAYKNRPVQFNIGTVLLGCRWDDIIADEAVVIRNGSSKQSHVMWALRKNSKVAVALTATPVNKSPDDMARLVAWCRNDKNMFSGVSLVEEYKTETVAGAKKLFEALGPLIFRRDVSEIAHKMPKSTQNVHLLNPSPAEKALTSAAEKELKRCYQELVAAIEELEKHKTTNNVDPEMLKTAREELKAANGAWLGGTQLARMATSDPAALLESSSTGAGLLAGMGLIEEAMKTEPTKRVKFLEIAQKAVLEGKQVVVFTSFTNVAELLAKSLNANGIKAKTFTGKNSTTRDKARIEFQKGELDVLVCTQAAQRGLTLHKAAVICHYDLPWTLEQIIQRTGRAIRLGSENPTVEVVFMIMKDTVEHRVAEQLVTQGVASSLIMDNSRGVDITKTETATAMSGLMTSMAKTTDNKNIIAYGKMLLGV